MRCFLIIVWLAFSLSCAMRAMETVTPAAQPGSPGLKNTTLLIIRHAEKPANGKELNALGVQRAQAYPAFFAQLQLDHQPLHLDGLYAAADSNGSHRSRLTLEPLGHELHLPVKQPFKNKDAPLFAQELRARPHGQHLLICWHHGEIPRLLAALGANPSLVLPHGQWPDEVFGWVVALRYDAEGRLQDTRLIHENLLPDNQSSPTQP